MAQLKFKVHPLFFIFGIYFALMGKVFYFLVYVLTAVLHEFGHYLASEKLGYKLNVITLLPFGAVITGDLDGLTYKDECFISICGPLANFITAIIFVALWWFVPDAYAYTDVVVVANFSVAIVNLLPAYPLDGGRFLYATLRLFLKRKTAKIIVVVIGIGLSLLLFTLFIISIFNEINLTLLFFSLFIFVGATSKGKQNAYIRLYSDLSFKIDKKIKPVKRLVVSKNVKLKNLFTVIDGNSYYIIDIVDDGGNLLKSYSGEEVYNLLINSSIYSTVSDAIIEN